MTKQTALLVVAALLAQTGCGVGISKHWQTANNDGKTPTWNPTSADLVAYLNKNASRIPGLQCNRVMADAKQGLGGGIGIDGPLVFEKPRNFRFRAKVAGTEQVDIGSNSDEFWYWIKQDAQPYVYHCSYADLNRGVQLGFPFQPDFLIAALGVQEYNPEGKYEVKTNRDTVELIETITSPQGQPMQKVVIFNRAACEVPKPQVQAVLLRTMEGKEVFSATYQETQMDKGTNAILPLRMKITLAPPQGSDKPELKMNLVDMKVVKLPPQESANIFSRTRMMGSRQGFDIARGQPDSAAGLRPVDGIGPVPR